MTPVEILAALDAFAKLLEIINAAAAGARERGEWTPEQEAEFDAKLAAMKSAPAWQVK